MIDTIFKGCNNFVCSLHKFLIYHLTHNWTLCISCYLCLWKADTVVRFCSSIVVCCQLSFPLHTIVCLLAKIHHQCVSIVNYKIIWSGGVVILNSFFSVQILFYVPWNGYKQTTVNIPISTYAFIHRKLHLSGSNHSCAMKFRVIFFPFSLWAKGSLCSVLVFSQKGKWWTKAASRMVKLLNLSDVLLVRNILKQKRTTLKIVIVFFFFKKFQPWFIHCAMVWWIELSPLDLWLLSFYIPSLLLLSLTIMVSLLQLDALNEKTLHAASSEMTISERGTEAVVLTAKNLGEVITKLF